MARTALLSTSRRFAQAAAALRTTRITTTTKPMRSYATSSETLNNHVKLVEVGPRDGLQNEKTVIPLQTKIELIERLAKTGLSWIEAGSFVSPKWVPQMDNSPEILSHLLTSPPPSAASPLTFSFLAPNTKGLNNCLAVLEKHPNSFAKELEGENKKLPHIEIAVFAAATESFSQKNLNTSISASLENFRGVISSAKETPYSLRVRGYISVVLGCPFEGYDVNPHQVAEVATALLEMGVDEISLGDTTGMGTAPRTKELLNCLRSAGIRNEDLAMHFHDTFGQALVNTAVALEHGVRTFDCSVAGLGGCPYSPGATGNVATEDMVYFMESLGMDTGVDLDKVADVGEWVSKEIGRQNASSVGRAVLGARKRKM
ncbi:3-hydroxy-3-isohexenylglutaryl-coa/hydroxy-methylglutaryl-CoA lyase [Podospora australis]|uniref:hydroxymethylglutaryl-CoA lyase n=1 Tax=Podospora australis TaxID=1536484 RepID=A0AAN6WQ63_9PEZI|nr:3-hydroxy-3-isohexenylglutaryl-coa/hydroxy-methylglutaryl-CoA lyase [Podospora australis]